MFEFRASKDFKKKKVSRTFDIEPQEILLDKLAQKKEEELGISERRFEVPLSKNILYFVYIISLILIFLLFVRSFQLQVVRGEYFTALSEGNKFIIYQLKATRGVIYDKNFEQLVFNQSSFDLICKKADLPEEEAERLKVFKEVSRILNEDLEILKEKVEESEAPQVSISENLSHQELIILETRIKELPGFQIENHTVRDYKEGAIFSHLIGYKRKTGEITGLEQSYDSSLGEEPGELLIERDAMGKEISKKIIQFPESGQSLVLWLDSDLQRKVTEALEKSLEIVGAKSGVAVAIDPKSGGVLALVSVPSFNNNLFSKGMSQEEWEEIDKNPLKPIFNRAIAGGYLTGSTIKPLIASAVLEEEIINPNKKINCQGLIEVKHKYDPGSTEYDDWRIHGRTDLQKAIAESCNVYFYTVGGGYEEQEGLGPTRIKEYLELFGWGDKTGIDLPGEIEGFVPDKEWKKRVWGEGWWDGDTYLLSIGQGYLLITPLEVVTSFGAIANGGRLLQPQVVQKIVDSEKNIIEEIGPQVLRENFIDSKNLQIVREGMRRAVTGVGSPHASAVSLNSLPVSSAAKTGTAQTPEEDVYHNWITVFAPYEAPEIVLTVMLEKVKGMQPAALPVAKEVLEWYFSR